MLQGIEMCLAGLCIQCLARQAADTLMCKPEQVWGASGTLGQTGGVPLHKLVEQDQDLHYQQQQ